MHPVSFPSLGSGEDSDPFGSLSGFGGTRTHSDSGRGADPDGSASHAGHCYASRLRVGGSVTESASDDEEYGDGRFSATLRIVRFASSLQQQLAARTKEVETLRLELEESNAAQEEMGQRLLGCTEYIADLERGLEQEARGRAALAAQSQLLQQQLQESDEKLSGTQATPLPAPRAQAAHPILGCLDPSHTFPTLGFDSTDPRDIALAALQRENQSLTQRLIASSLAAAQAREREEEARHQVCMLQDLNAEMMASINALSLELNLLRPNACGRARGRFTLDFLRGSTTGGASKGA
ncbi:hypothetical protein GPECTOR_5g193 [Gonium pectorale]|uniref:Uncharacterized protein n=1 Tax=Gonium pectorale TaxID=33097 RepID=A0A150GWN6_GONPE|nr:hypothetical protein GPECTOR_5g193 [Gonium pectorale]|eukprot:KXZ54088.1 hypothetical protein GPECTOR_5g193 [Gonium pectorale]